MERQNRRSQNQPPKTEDFTDCSSSALIACSRWLFGYRYYDKQQRQNQAEKVVHSFIENLSKTNSTNYHP